MNMLRFQGSIGVETNFQKVAIIAYSMFLYSYCFMSTQHTRRGHTEQSQGHTGLPNQGRAVTWSQQRATVITGHPVLANIALGYRLQGRRAAAG